MSENIAQLLELKLRLNKKFENYNENVSVGDYSYGDFKVYTWDNKTKLKIGKFCSIAEGVKILLGGEHRSDFVTTYPFNALLKDFNYIEGHPHTKGDIIIENDVWIGSDAKILSGVKIHNGAIVGANSIITKDIFNNKIIEKLLDVKWWDFKEEELVKVIPLLQSNNINEFLLKYG